MARIVSVFTTGNQTVEAAVLSCHWLDHKQKINFYDCSNLNQKEVWGEHWNILITAQYVNHRHRFTKTIYHKMKSMDLSRWLIDAHCAEELAEVISGHGNSLSHGWPEVIKSTGSVEEQNAYLRNHQRLQTLVTAGISVSLLHTVVRPRPDGLCWNLSVQYLSSSCSLL